MEQTIDTSAWRNFRVGDFFDVSYGRFVPKSQSNEHGAFPHITTTATNNGIGYYVDKPMFNGNAITVASDGNQGVAFYQAVPFSASNIVSAVIPHPDVPLNEYSANFICALFRKEGEKYSWGGFKYSVDRVRETRLLMPAVAPPPHWQKLQEILSGGVDMSKIDTSDWKEYKVCDLFGKAKLGPYHNPKTLEPDKDGVLYICASNKNNGINEDMPRVKEDGASLTPANIIAWGKQCPFFAYHDEPCITAQGMYYYELPGYDEQVCLYITTAMQRAIQGKNYGYDNCLIGAEADNLVIKLPASDSYEPDWAYMESYMKQIMRKSAASLENLRLADRENQLVDANSWGEFKIGDIFNVVKGTRLTKADMKDGAIKFVGSSALNNGETHRIANDEKLHPANTITVCYNGSVGETFYQDEIFWASDDVNVLYPQFDMTKEKALFICPILKSVGRKYAFVDKWKQEDMKNEIIKLPVTQTGEPDWVYMESYMKSVFSRAEQTLSHLNH